MNTRRRTRKRECSSYELSTTKHPLNNSVINSPGRLRRPVPPLVPPFPSAYTPETFAGIREEGTCGSRSFHPMPFLFSVVVSISLPLSRSLSLLYIPLSTFTPHAYSSLRSSYPPLLFRSPSNPSSPLVDPPTGSN